MESSLKWQVALDAKPTVVQMGIATHGIRPVEHYHLNGLWCVHLYRYSGELRVDGHALAIQPGNAGLAPPNIDLEYHYRERSTHIYAHFSLPPARRGRVAILAMQDLGRDFSELNQTFEQALAYLPTQPRRTEIKLWDILWMLAEKTNRSSRAAEGVHPAIQKAFQLIEQRLGERIRVSELARDVEISHNQLTRLFQTATGGTVVEYIRARRMQRVEHLLVHSTMQIKAIAYEVGLGDLQQFNKAVHRAFGASPRNIRNRR